MAKNENHEIDNRGKSANFCKSERTVRRYRTFTTTVNENTYPCNSW